MKLSRLAIGFLLFPIAALATKDVSSPDVKKGVLKYEARYGMEYDEKSSAQHRFRQFYLAEYGVTDWYSTRVNGKWSKTHTSQNDFTNLEWENKFQFFKQERNGFDGAVKLVYSIADNSNQPDNISMRGIGQKSIGDWNFRVNATVARDVAESVNGSPTFSTAWQVLYKTDNKFSIGVEMFSDFNKFNDMENFNRQSHQIGPVFNFKINSDLSLEGGYLFGTSDSASDGLLKFFIKGKF